MEEQQNKDVLNEEKNLEQAAESAEAIVMTTAEDDGDGYLKISNSVLASIVRKFTLEVDGVVRFQNQSLMDGMWDILGKRTGDRSIVIDIDGNDASVTLALIVRFGARIPKVAANIKSLLCEKIEELTGYKVAKVNINVVDVEEVIEPADETAPAEEASAEEVSHAGTGEGAEA